MPNATSFLGIILIVLGGWAYTTSVSRSPMALIPLFLGVVFLALGIAGGRDAWRRHAMHAAAGLALLGLLGGLGPALMMPNAPPLMRRATLTMSILCAVFLVAAVRSFIAARRGRAAE